jgi:hypothetical protein
MRLAPPSVLIVLLASPAAFADGEDARAIMREAATQQADSMPPVSGPSADPAAGFRARIEGESGRDTQTAHGASAEAHRAAVSAARAELAVPSHQAAPLPGSSAARAANARNGAANAGQRGAASVAREHSVHAGGGGRNPPSGGGRP